ncbi:MAG: endonuclease [Bacilli bacterium]
MAKKKKSFESLITTHIKKTVNKRITPSKSTSSKTHSIKQKRSNHAKVIQNEAKDQLISTILRKPKSKKQRILKWFYVLLLLIVMSGSGLFVYEEVAPFSPINHYEPTELSAYYQGADGLEGSELRSYLSTLLNSNFVGVNYGVARQALAIADADPNNSSHVLTIYTRESVKGEWDGKTWTREHVWPNSRLGVPRVSNTKINQASDLHNLRAIIQSVNSSRSNKVFDLITTTNTYYPGEDRGDVARILFYMVLKWDILSLVDDILPNDTTTNYTLEGAKMSRFSVLWQWHFEDPVDDFERNRNEVIYGYQNNRNPFIDHPEWVALIFDNPQDLSVEHSNKDFFVLIKEYYQTLKYSIHDKKI